MTYTPPNGILVVGPGMPGPQKGERIEVRSPSNVDELDMEVFSRALKVPTLMPCGLHRVDDPQTDPTLHHLNCLYVGPELARRLEQGQGQTDLVPVRQVLIALPRESAGEPRVLINDDVRVIGHVALKYGSVNKGEPLQAQRILDAYELEFDGLDATTEGFIWIVHQASGYSIYWNLLPCNPDVLGDAETVRALSSLVREGMADRWFRSFFGDPFAQDTGLREQLVLNGWLPSPAILPDPWRAMCAAMDRGEVEEVGRLAIAAVSDELLDEMLANWRPEEPFASDIAFLERGIGHYKSGDYISAVSVLLPRIEGLINRAIAHAGVTAQRRIADAFGLLEQAARGAGATRWVGRNLRERLVELVRDFFGRQFDPAAPDAGLSLGRHAHAHGATMAALYDQAYALKVILTLDALFFAMCR